MSDNVFTKFCGKTVRNGYKSTILEYCDKSTMNTIGNVHILSNFIFPTSRSTKHSVDWLLADYIGFYRHGSRDSDKYGFVLSSI